MELVYSGIHCCTAYRCISDEPILRKKLAYGDTVK